MLFFVGTGKSHLILAFRNFITVNNMECKVAAFTGKAANNINGITLHSLLYLPIGGKFADLKGNSLQVLQNNFSSSTFLIIDEYRYLNLYYRNNKKKFIFVELII